MPGAGRAPQGPALAPEDTARAARDVQCSFLPSGFKVLSVLGQESSMCQRLCQNRMSLLMDGKMF